MTIQFNTDNNLTVHEQFGEKLTSVLTNKLNRFSEHITRLEVHLSDDNSHKVGPKDKNCLLEARVKNMQPIAVTAEGDTYEHAVDGAIEKLKRSLDSTFGRLQDR